MSWLSWETFAKNEYGVIRGGISGQYGDMPYEPHMMKQEQTFMYEPEGMVDNHHRSVLRDRTPDAPTMASDLPRETQDTLRKMVLNVREGGARTLAEPIHPDLFLGFTERDNRGYHNQPDMRLAVDQSRSRMRFKDLKTDIGSDWSVPEGTRSELRQILDRHKAIEPTRQRLKIFSTSRDAMPVPSAQKRFPTHSKKVKTTPDGVVMNLADAQMPWQRKDNTSLKSDTIRIGYRQTGDHRFKVAQYSILSKKAQRSNIHEANKKTSGSQPRGQPVSVVKNKLAIQVMNEMKRRKHLRNWKGDMEYNFKGSVDTQNKIYKYAKDLARVQNATITTADVIDLSHVGDNIKKVRIYDPVSHDAVVIDQNVFGKILEHQGTKIKFKVKDTLNRQTHATEGMHHASSNSMKAHVYSRIDHKGTAPLPTHMEHMWYDSDYAPIYQQNHIVPEIVNTNTTLYEQGVIPTSDSVFDPYKRTTSNPVATRNRTVATSITAPTTSDVDNDVRKALGRGKV